MHPSILSYLYRQCTLSKNTFPGIVHLSCRFLKGAPAKLKSNILLINLDFYGLRTLCNIYNLKTNTLLGGKFLMKMCELDFLGGHFWGHSKNPSQKFENLKTFPQLGGPHKGHIFTPGLTQQTTTTICLTTISLTERNIFQCFLKPGSQKYA